MRNKKGYMIILMLVMSSIVLNIEINNNINSTNHKHNIQNVKDKTPEQSDDFSPQPSIGDKYWNFTTGEIVGWRISTDYSTRDMIFNITDLKYFTEADNVYGSGDAYYGIQLTPAYYNISTHQVEEFTNHTVFPLLNATLVNYTLPKAYGIFSVDNLVPFAFQNENGGGPEYFINPFVPTNSSNDLLDIYWAADALRWWYSIFLNGNFEIDGSPIPPQNPSELCDLTVTSNSIQYSKPSKGTYCNLYYYNNGTLRTGEFKGFFMPSLTLTINWTRIFDFNPLNDLKWSENFNTFGDILYLGMDVNETKLVFNHTVDNMELNINWNDENEEWEVELLYYQEIWANYSYWNDDTKEWEYINCTVVASANELSPIVFGGDDDGGDDDMFLPPFILIPNQSTYLSLGDMFKIFELNPDWSDLRVQTGDNWVKLTNTSSSNIAVFSYQTDGILEYIYIQAVGPFEEMTKDGDGAIMFYYKNFTLLSSLFNTFSLHAFDLGSLSAVINISINTPNWLYHSGFPYNPTNQSISNALGFFDIFMENDIYLDQTYFAPINITFYYDHNTYQSVKVYWFNMSADNNKGAWEEIPIKNLGNGVIVITLNHTSIIVFTASKIVLSSGDGGGGKKEKEAAIPLGNSYLLFIAVGIIGLLIYERRKYLKNKF